MKHSPNTHRGAGIIAYMEQPLDREFARKPWLPVFFVRLLVHGHKMAHVSQFVWKMACVEPDSGATKTLCKTPSFSLSGNFEVCPYRLCPLLHLDLPRFSALDNKYYFKCALHV